MTWTTPKTWTTEPLTSLDMNTHIRDNLNALKSPPTVDATPNANNSITATTFVDVPNTTLTLTTTGGDIVVGWTGIFLADVGGSITAAVRFDGTDYTIGLSSAGGFVPMCGTRLFRTVGAGTHTITLRVRVTSGTGQIQVYQVWAREIS